MLVLSHFSNHRAFLFGSVRLTAGYQQARNAGSGQGPRDRLAVALVEQATELWQLGDRYERGALYIRVQQFAVAHHRDPAAFAQQLVKRGCGSSVCDNRSEQAAGD